jgi:hypothetical protein
MIDLDLEAPLGDLRIALMEVDTLAAMTKVIYDEADWMEPDSRVVEAIAALLGLIDKSAYAAMDAYHRLQRLVSDAAPAPEGERRPKGMSAEDAAIVRRIRTQCADRRFDGGTDTELLDLFKRNKRTLERSDDDVVAVMTRPR